MATCANPTRSGAGVLESTDDVALDTARYELRRGEDVIRVEPQVFAAPVSAPAGMYTAALDGSRASWIVRPDGSVTGVQFNGGITGRDFEQAELQQLNTAQFQAQVRNKRILQQADQSVKLQNGTLTWVCPAGPFGSSGGVFVSLKQSRILPRCEVSA
jgi:hypothetical protein